ncbi:MAG: signal peptidase II [Streptosporangiaceae bacterium]
MAHRRVGLLLGVAVAVITADLVSKVLVVANIPEQTYVHVIGSVFMLTQVRNGGAAFNLGGTSITIVFTLIAAGVVTYILRAASSLRSAAWAITLGLLLGGATGNLIDRIFRAPAPGRGDVVDWIEVTRYWPVFNVADSCIVCAGILVVLLALNGVHLDGTRTIRATEATKATEAAEAGETAEAAEAAQPDPDPPTSPVPPALPVTSAPSTAPERDYPKPNYPESKLRPADDGR